MSANTAREPHQRARFRTRLLTGEGRADREETENENSISRLPATSRKHWADEGDFVLDLSLL
jgi:hypothetical protein